jgi:hypothetical protein
MVDEHPLFDLIIWPHSVMSFCFLFRKDAARLERFINGFSHQVARSLGVGHPGALY